MEQRALENSRGRFAFLSRPVFQIPFVAVFAALCFFGKLHQGELRTLDTATYAQIAKEMYLNGG
ncbi:MAG: hypothetical protein E3J72_07395 [Planctomycetota bacterium]|nr:MAG: hypothetical protein E3J72_07395 [Planctomycetota bacterium]